MAAVGQCASLKVRQCANPSVFAVNLSARGRESWWCETWCAARRPRGRGAGAARSWRSAAWQGKQGVNAFRKRGNLCAYSLWCETRFATRCRRGRACGAVSAELRGTLGIGHSFSLKFLRA